MPEFQVCAWWYTQRGANDRIEADDPQDALAKLKGLAEGDTDWISHNKEYDDSDGTTNYEVMDTDGNIVAEDPSDAERLNRAAPKLLKALSDLVEEAREDNENPSLIGCFIGARAAITEATAVNRPDDIPVLGTTPIKE